MSLLVAIPSRSNFSGLRSVVEHCRRDSTVVKLVVYDNGYEDEEERQAIKDWGVHVDAVGWPFYAMWNHAWKTAAEEGFFCVALLNDDISLDGKSLSEAVRVLQINPQAGIVGLNYRRSVAYGTKVGPSKTVRGSYRNGGIGGHAFLVRASTWGVVPPIDERYALWYGDDELFDNMNRHGFSLEIATGAPVDHATSTTSVKYPELLARTSEDEKLFRSKWG